MTNVVVGGNGNGQPRGQTQSNNNNNNNKSSVMLVNHTSSDAGYQVSKFGYYWKYLVKLDVIQIILINPAFSFMYFSVFVFQLCSVYRALMYVTTIHFISAISYLLNINH